MSRQQIVAADASAAQAYDGFDAFTPPTGQTTQYKRVVQLTVGDPTGNALDLSHLRIVFYVKRGDVQTPNSATIRVYNPADSTVQKVTKEYTQVLLTAGYAGNQGVIFRGTIVNKFYGRESPTDTFLLIQATDSDQGYNFATVRDALAAGHTQQDVSKAIQKGMDAQGVLPPRTEPDFGPAYQAPRGRAFFGMARDYARNLARSTGQTWGIQDGAMQYISTQAYLPGETIVLNARTGLIGMPQLTIDGILFRCLLNVGIQVNRRVQIDNGDIQGLLLNLEYTAVQQVPKITDGYYRVIAMDHVGDTRGQDFYTNAVCIGINDALPIGQAVRGYV